MCENSKAYNLKIQKKVSFKKHSQLIDNDTLGSCFVQDCNEDFVLCLSIQATGFINVHDIYSFIKIFREKMRYISKNVEH